MSILDTESTPTANKKQQNVFSFKHPDELIKYDDGDFLF
jgi:hypothetical protein